MSLTQTKYGMRREVALPYHQAVERVREELGTEGFGVLTEIDVKATLKQKIDVDFRPYVILGACDPTLAHHALTEESDIGLLLPCNVIVYQMDNPEHSIVAAIDPVTQLSITGNEELTPVSQDVQARLTRVLERIA
ncbi:MAG: DUF302 domain-containing protein [Gemmatimonadales bacterium]